MCSSANSQESFKKGIKSRHFCIYIKNWKFSKIASWFWIDGPIRSIFELTSIFKIVTWNVNFCLKYTFLNFLPKLQHFNLYNPFSIVSKKKGHFWLEGKIFCNNNPFSNFRIFTIKGNFRPRKSYFWIFRPEMVIFVQNIP